MLAIFFFCIRGFGLQGHFVVDWSAKHVGDVDLCRPTATGICNRIESFDMMMRKSLTNCEFVIHNVVIIDH